MAEYYEIHEKRPDKTLEMLWRIGKALNVDPDNQISSINRKITKLKQKYPYLKKKKLSVKATKSKKSGASSWKMKK